MKNSEIIEAIKTALMAAVAERQQRADFRDGAFEWERYEREVALEQVNKLRADMGKEPMAMSLVLMAETKASGHSMYITEFAINLTQLVSME